METTTALVITGKEKIEFQELPMPEPGDYEVLFHSQASSICTIDKRAYKEIRKTEYPFLGGHECSGIVEKVGRGVVDLKPGDHAIITSAYCMQCANDRFGHENICPNKNKLPKRVECEGNLLGCGFCEYLAVPVWQVIKVDKNVKFEHACLAEPLACVVHSIKKAQLKLADTVVIVGFGVMGYLHLKLSLLQGARVIVSEPNEANRKRALEAGACRAVDPINEDLGSIIDELTNGRGCDVVFNTIPNSSAWKDIFRVLGTNGKVIAYSSQDVKEGVPVDFGQVHSKEYQLIGAVSPTLEDNETAVRLISYGIIDISKIIDDVYDFKDGVQAFEQACQPGSYRVVMRY